MKEAMEYQMKVYNDRKTIIQRLQAIKIGDVTKEKVNELDEELKKLNEDASEVYNKIFQTLIKIQDERHQEALGLVDRLRSFLNKNDAKLPEGRTFDMLIAEQCTPLLEQRQKESKELLLHIDKYLQEFDSRMHEYTKNIISFYRFIGESMTKKERTFKNLEFQFEVAVAKLADQNEEGMNKRDEDLKSQVDSLKKSVTHISLVERLQNCYTILDSMNLEYDKYEAKLKELIGTQEPKIVQNYQDFELKLARHFKMEDLKSKDRIQERLTKETEEKQKKLEEEYLKKKELEEQQQAAAAGKAPPPAKGKAPPEKPKAKGKPQNEALLAEVPKLEVPKVPEYKSPSGETYVVDCPLEVLAESLMRTEEEIEKQKAEEARIAEEKKKEEALAAETKPGAKGGPGPGKGKVDKQKEDQAKKEEEEKLQKEKSEEEQKKKAEAEYKLKLRTVVPKDPEGQICLHESLLFTKHEVTEILLVCLKAVMEQIGESKSKYVETLRKKNEETVYKLLIIHPFRKQRI